MFDDLPTLTHQEQQDAVEEIQKLMQEGVSTAKAIQVISQKIRAQKNKEQQAKLNIE